jgi:hypothetical protein
MSLPNPAELLPQMAAALTRHLNQRHISEPRFIGIRTGGIWVARTRWVFSTCPSTATISPRTACTR